MDEPDHVLDAGTRIVTHDELAPSCMGFIGSAQFVNARKPGERVKIRGFVPGHGGDVYYGENEDGSIAVYGWHEFELETTEEMKSMKDERDVTTRRTIQQIKHCVQEALSIVENDEDVRCARDDLQQAEKLIQLVFKKLPK